MAIPNTNWSEITTTTLYNRSQKLADNVTKNNALLRRLSQKSKIKPFDGGQAIVQEIEYSENGTFKRYSGYDVLSISPSDVFTSAQYPIAQAAVAISISVSVGAKAAFGPLSSSTTENSLPSGACIFIASSLSTMRR